MVNSAIAVAWSDPTGAGGIAADLRTFGAFAVHGAGIVSGFRPGTAAAVVPSADLKSQIETAVATLGAVPAKVSLTGSAATDSESVSALSKLGVTSIVVDAGSASRVGGLDPRAVEAFKSDVASSVTILVADIAAAQALTGVRVANQSAMRAVAKLLRRLGCRFVLVTGSQLPGDDVTDIMFDGEQTWDFPGERPGGAEPVETLSTYASAITAGLAHGRSPEESVAVARIYLTEVIRSGFVLNDGIAVASQLYSWWSGGGAQGYGAS